jgi:hypothetical protein
MKRIFLSLAACFLVSACQTTPEKPSPVADSPRSLGWSYMGSDASWEGAGAWGSGFPMSR